MLKPIRQLFISALTYHARRQLPLSDSLHKISKLYVTWFEGRTYDGRHNGEVWLIERLADQLRVVFDVGANRGDWSAVVLKNSPDAEIHAFEIIPNTAKELFDAWGDKIRANAFGLSDTNEELDVIFSQSHDRGSRMVIDEGYDRNYTTVRGKVHIGDDYCSQHQIAHIDLLKVDVEGAEQNVLFGLKGMIRDGNVDVIQFEYNHARLHSRFLLRDFYDLLGAEYALGRLTNRGVRFKEYELTDEDFAGPNYVAVLRSRQDLINRTADPAAS
ncbi:FkbM family methyltransferase [Altererythrobacter sp. GH1-8]|uniref:FkbM family methyltransferase n=1 Tax=Altererythrobacter sp. GH1-8 TaxID=3349333 RepID=UPI00374D98DC